MTTYKQGKEIPTIDVTLVTISSASSSDEELALTTANKIGVEVQENTTDPIQLIVKGVLLAQKGSETTVTGHQIVLTDNVFNFQLAKIIQGGVIKYWTSAEKTATQDSPSEFGIAGYTPPVAGSKEKGEIFTLNAYSAIYDSAGVCTGYEKVSYPNCQGKPFGLNSEDGVFRVSEYTINSAPKAGQAPYTVELVSELPEVSNYEE